MKEAALLGLVIAGGLFIAIESTRFISTAADGAPIVFETTCPHCNEHTSPYNANGNGKFNGKWRCDRCFKIFISK